MKYESIQIGRALPGNRPYVSPYCAGDVFKIQFMENPVACVPRELINRHPELAARFDDLPADEPLKFPNVPERVGHTIVHFLFTGTWQTLPTPPDRSVSKLSVRLYDRLLVYFQAIELGLDELVELATQEISKQAQDMTFAGIIKVLSEEFTPLGGRETWLIEYLIGRAIMDDKPATEEEIQKFRAIMSNRAEVIDILLESAMHLGFRLRQPNTRAR